MQSNEAMGLTVGGCVCVLIIALEATNNTSLQVDNFDKTCKIMELNYLKNAISATYTSSSAKEHSIHNQKIPNSVAST